MTVLISEKGENFVLNTYREILPNNRKGVSRLKKLAIKFGPFAYLENKDKFIKTILSQDPGYLLAETTLAYLQIDDQPWIIYLEESSENKSMIMVVVDQGEIVRDVLIPTIHVEDTLKEISQENNPYEFHIVDLKSTNIDIVSIVKKQFYNKNSACKIKKYTQSIFNQIGSLKKYKLLGVDAAIKATKIKNHSYIYILFFTLFFSIIYIINYYNNHRKSEEEQLVSTYNHSRKIREAFNLPSPKKIVKEIQECLIRVQYTAGWPVTHMTYAPGSFLLTVEPISPRTEYLKKWVENQNISYNTETSQISFSLATVEKNLTLKGMRPIATAEKKLTHILRRILHTKALESGKIENKGPYKVVYFTIDIKNQTIVFLELIAEVISEFPAVLSSVNLKIDKAIINGTMKIELRGI